jgi:hypothetical protein
LGRHCRESLIRSEEIMQRMVGMLYRQYALVIDGKIRVCGEEKTRKKYAREENCQ